eukprot:COSAG06_NODE_1660_length_8775_cov_6.138380_2_plen_140_part_00
MELLGRMPIKITRAGKSSTQRCVLPPLPVVFLSLSHFETHTTNYFIVIKIGLGRGWRMELTDVVLCNKTENDRSVSTREESTSGAHHFVARLLFFLLLAGFGLHSSDADAPLRMLPPVSTRTIITKTHSGGQQRSDVAL